MSQSKGFDLKSSVERKKKPCPFRGFRPPISKALGGLGGFSGQGRVRTFRAKRLEESKQVRKQTGTKMPICKIERTCHFENYPFWYRFGAALSGQAIRTPTFRRFARIDSRESICKTIPTFEALGQIRANRVFSPIRIGIRVICVQSSLLSHFLEGRFAKKGFSKREFRFTESLGISQA